MLVVIAIIAILASLIVSVISRIKVHTQIVQAQSEISMIEQAVSIYHSTYSRYPVSAVVMTASAVPGGDDFTYGGTFNNGSTTFQIADAKSGLVKANDEVIAVLMDLPAYPSGAATVNANHARNPQQLKLLPAKLSGYDPASGAKAVGGVDVNGVYRDPWGNPYVISMDLNGDEKCLDSFYRQKLVSQQNGSSGFNGLFNTTDSGGNGDNFAFNGGVMVWSLGPNRNASVPPQTGVSATTPPNKDNVLSWK
jgi:type II secretory pathway pseudopilin PulG